MFAIKLSISSSESASAAIFFAGDVVIRDNPLHLGLPIFAGCGYCVYECKALERTKMLDLFAILTKGGLVLWCLEGTPFSTTLASVNALIKDVILQVS